MSSLPLPNTTKDPSPVVPNLTLRLALLRTICCLAFASFISSSVMANYFEYPINLFILLHHMAVPFFPRIKIFNGLVDLVVTVVEIGALVFIVLVTSVIVDSWSTRVSIVAATIWWMLLISVAMFAVLKVINTIAVKGKNLFVRIDITDARWMHHAVSRNLNGPDESMTSIRVSKKLTAHDVLLGRSLWKAKLAGEQKWMIISRGFFAVLFVIIMVMFGIVVIILGPVREAALVPVNILRSRALPSDTVMLQRATNIVLARVTKEANGRNRTSGEIFAGAAQVTLLRDRNETRPIDPCTSHKIWPHLYDYGFNRNGDSARIISFDCGNYKAGTQPDILVTVNFTKLGIQSDTIDNVAKNSVQVMLGLVDDPLLVVDNTLPVTLIPGMNVFGMTNVIIRQQLQLSALSKFGIFDSYDTFYVSEMGHLISDPSPSPLITRAQDIATIRIAIQVDPSAWKVVQDSREKSVLKGFSNVGGLWTSLCGIFAILFGSSLLRVMFNVKPFSIFGLMHSIQREEIRDSCLKEYPRIPNDLKTEPEVRGILSLLSDYFVDLDFLQPGPNMIPNTPDNSDIPLTRTSLREDAEDQSLMIHSALLKH